MEVWLGSAAGSVLFEEEAKNLLAYTNSNYHFYYIHFFIILKT